MNMNQGPNRQCRALLRPSISHCASKPHIIRDYSKSDDIRKKHNHINRYNKEKIAAMTQMINNIGHRWRQPLNALAIMIQDIKHAKEYGELSYEYLEAVCARSMNIIDRMSKTIDEFRFIFKPSEDAVVFDVKRRLQGAVRFVSDSMAAHNIKIDMRCRDDVSVFGYPEAFSQAILKILSNAKEALLESGVKEPRIHIYMSLKNGDCVIKISNNGPKIDDCHLNRIFEPYYTTKDEGKGDQGLGLYAVKMLIEEAMSGDVSVVSNDESTTFKIILKALPQT